MDNEEISEVISNILLYDEYDNSAFKTLERKDLAYLDDSECEMVIELLEVEFLTQLRSNSEVCEDEMDSIRGAYFWLIDTYDLEISQRMEEAFTEYNNEIEWGNKPLVFTCFNCGFEEDLEELDIYRTTEEAFEESMRPPNISEALATSERIKIVSNIHNHRCPECRSTNDVFIAKDEYSGINSRKDVRRYNKLAETEKMSGVLSLFSGVSLIGALLFFSNHKLLPTIGLTALFFVFVFLFIGSNKYKKSNYSWNRPAKYRKI